MPQTKKVLRALYSTWQENRFSVDDGEPVERVTLWDSDDVGNGEDVKGKGNIFDFELMFLENLVEDGVNRSDLWLSVMNSSDVSVESGHSMASLPNCRSFNASWCE